ncbi:uncharacterized protein LOC111406912 [Olea europaea var. sylvestris]|uniref:uncharacterized protein LOC111406912 n=1 Tax=Olea europaea var. sylvestris TaxID=158386 RepID=UPI000C1D6872|nr:uncharacterized protein LOC111406912 [Olea europaea var. sylvestris]
MFGNELSIKKQVSLSKEVGELYHSLFPFKRNRSPQTESLKHKMMDLTETESSGTKRHLKRDDRFDNSVIESIPSPGRVFSEIPASSSRDPSLDEAKKCIGRYFYETATDFDVVKSCSFRTMIDSTLGHGKIIPSCEELKGWILEDAVKAMQNFVKDIRTSWISTGCSIVLDGWIDEKGRDLVNILVNSPKGAVYLRSSDISAFVGDVDAMLLFLEKVLDEVGVENVIQVITYSTSAFMKEVGERLTNKHRHVFWTVSASTCLELMLVKFESMSFIRDILEKARTITSFVQNHPSALKLLRAYTRVENLVKSSKIRSAEPYLTLENIVLEKKGLENMFSSSEWRTSDLSDSIDGKNVDYLVADPTFWNGALVVLTAAIPIVRVLYLINKNNKPQIGLIYETMDRAKKTIKEGFKNKESLYMPFWKEIDNIWIMHLHSPLHCAGYNLNPTLFYTDGYHNDLEVHKGLFLSIIKMNGDSRVQELIMMQLQEYLRASDAFSVGSKCLSDFSPALWWKKFAEKYPELQRLATQILSQSCDGASKFKLKRSLVEFLLTKEQNCTEQQILKDLIFVQYNLQLQNFETSQSSYISANEIGPMNNWKVDEAHSGDIEPSLMGFD